MIWVSLRQPAGYIYTSHRRIYQQDNIACEVKKNPFKGGKMSRDFFFPLEIEI